MRRLLLALALVLAVSPAARAQCGASQVPVRVFLMYGLVSAALSSGMADLAAKLNRIRGVTASTHEWISSGAIADEAIRTKAAVVIGGHSIGANAAVSAARQLDGKRRVALLLGFDPSSLASLEPVPANVARAISFTQSGNPFGGNVLQAASRATSITRIRRQMSHVEVDKNPEYHAIAIRAVCAIASR